MIENKESMTAKLCAFARAFYSSANQTSPNNDYLAKELLGRHEYASIHEMIKTGQCPGICPSYNHHQGILRSYKFYNGHIFVGQCNNRNC